MTPEPPPPHLFDTALMYLAMIGAWIIGEGGRAAMAGVAGGIVRWLMSEKKRMRDGAVSVISGALMAHYCTPVTLALLEMWLGDMKGDTAFTAAFCSGLVGMSLAKLVIGYIDSHGRRVQEKEADE